MAVARRNWPDSHSGSGFSGPSWLTLSTILGSSIENSQPLWITPNSGLRFGPGSLPICLILIYQIWIKWPVGTSYESNPGWRMVKNSTSDDEQVTRFDGGRPYRCAPRQYWKNTSSTGKKRREQSWNVSPSTRTHPKMNPGRPASNLRIGSALSLRVPSRPS